MASLQLREETATGRETGRLVLNDVPEKLTIRELIRRRVQAMVDGADVAVDVEAKAVAAERSFLGNRFLIFVDGRQTEDLDEVLTVAEADTVSFVKLVPLVGG